MTRKPKLTPKQEQAQFRAAGRAYAAMAGVEPMPMDMEPVARPAVFRTARDRIPHRGEADVLRDILALLHRHPKVAIVTRQNSGALPDATGRMVRFNRVRIQGVKGALISDITGTLKNGKPFAIECKEPNWKEPDWFAIACRNDLASDKQMREMGQKLYLDAIRQAGGIGIFATDISQVITALEEA